MLFIPRAKRLTLTYKDKIQNTNGRGVDIAMGNIMGRGGGQIQQGKMETGVIMSYIPNFKRSIFLKG